jgi:hypothetical protein
VLLVSITSTTVDTNSILVHAAAKGLWYDVVHLPEFWPAGIALCVFLVLVRLKRRQYRNYAARAPRGRAAGPARCETCERPVSANVRNYCSDRANTFGGQVLCYQHQRPYLRR